MADENIISFKALADLVERGELTVEDIRARYGHVAARAIGLASEVDELRWPKLDYPPKMFIAHKWREDGSATPEAQQLAEALRATGVEVIFDAWWPKDERSVESRIAQIAGCRTIYFLLTDEYFAHTSLARDQGPFRATWVEDELYFAHTIYEGQFEASYHGAILDAVGLVLSGEHEPIPWFSRVFDVRTPSRWQGFLASFSGLQVASLDDATREQIRAEALALAEALAAGRTEVIPDLLALARRHPFVGDLWRLLVEVTQGSDPAFAEQCAREGLEHTEGWRHESRVLRGLLFSILLSQPDRVREAIVWGLESRDQMPFFEFWQTEVRALLLANAAAVRAQLGYEDAPSDWCCSECPARYPDTRAVCCCHRCGALRPPPPSLCPSCGSDTIVPLIHGVGAVCPICKRGRLAQAGGGTGATSP